MLKDLSNVNRTKNYKIASHVNNALIDLRYAVNRKEIPKNEIPDKELILLKKFSILRNNKMEKNLHQT